MMTPSLLITELRKLFPENQWSWVAPALQLDPLIWDCLQGELGERLLSRRSTRPEDYSPLALALLTRLPASHVQNESTPDIAQQMSDLKAWAEENGSLQPPLLKASLEAWSLQQQALSGGTWHAHPGLAAAPATVLACLMGLATDIAPILDAVLRSGLESPNPAIGLDGLLRGLLSNPLPPKTHSALLGSLAKQLPHQWQPWFARHLAGYRPDLAAVISLELVESPVVLPDVMPEDGFAQRLANLAIYQRQGYFNELAGQPSRAASQWEQISHRLEQLNALALARQAQAAQNSGDGATALRCLDQAIQLDGENAEYHARRSLALIQAGRSADAQGHLEAFQQPLSAWMQMAHAHLALARGHYEPAREAAVKAWELVEADLDPAFTEPADLAKLAELLLSAGKPAEACSASARALQGEPGNVDVLALSARANLAAGRAEAAAQAAHLAAAIQPGKALHHVLLAECLGSTGDWSAAYRERKQLSAEPGRKDPQEQYKLAASALLAGETTDAIQVAERLVEENPIDGLAWAVLGEATTRSGNPQGALLQLVKATNLASQHAAPWLSLAALYRQMGLEQKSIETLQAGSYAAPGFPEILLALGQAYFSRGLLTQAHAALQQAADLLESGQISTDDVPWYRTASITASNDPAPAPITAQELPGQVYYLLGSTLLKLGHLDQASRMLGKAYEHNPGDGEVAWQYAQALLATNDRSAALPPLKAVVDSGIEDLSPYLHYARLILDLKPAQSVANPASTAIPYLQHVLQASPGHPEATAYLGEALAAQKDWPGALQAYQRALESDLAMDPAWQARLSLGIGTAAMQLGQVDMAIAALQEASQTTPQDATILRSLSEAYLQAGLQHESHQAALQAHSAGANDPDNLSWVANQLEKLADLPGIPTGEAEGLALQALQRATQIAPDRYDLWVRLGQIYEQVGEPDNAQLAYQALADTHTGEAQPDSLDLYQAAIGLLRTGDPVTAATCLEHSMQSNQAARDGAAPTLLDTLTQLTKAQYLSSAFDKALVTLEQIIVLDSNEPQCQLVKAGILAQMSRSVAEIESCVHAAQVMERQDPILHQHAACIYRLAGALPQALRHADQWVQRSAKQPTQNLLARAMAADLALAILQPSIARQYLRAGISISEMADTDLEVQPEPEGDDLPGLVIPGTGLTVTDYFLSRAELALESGDDHEAIDELVQVMEVVPLSPRLMALQARLAIQRNELQNAQALLSSALDTANAPAEPSFTLLATAASAALELQNWQTASDLWQQAVEKYPLEPRAHLLFARTLVKQAEFQRMCQAMNIVRHAPAADALSENTYQRYERAIKSAKDLIEGWETMPGSLPASQNDKPLPMPALFQDVLGQIERWHKRGEAAFAPSAEAAQALASLPATAEDTAARVACLRQLNELQAAGLAARAYPQDPMVLIQLTLALMNDKPRQALAAIQVAIDNMIKAGRMEPGRAQESTASLTPMVHALTARLLHYNGNRIEDRQAALQAIRMALASWHDEPRWHTLAADIHLTLDNQPDSPDQQAAMIHLKQAIEMEPGNALPYLKIGQIQYADCGYAEALQAFEQAVSLEPDNPTPFIWLARTHLKANDLEQAAAHAERAISLAPDEPEPVLLRGEIALSLNQPRNAQTYAENVLRVYPDHTGALVLLAHALDQMGRPDEALALVEKALAKAGEPLALRLERVRLLQRARGAEPALQAAERLADELADEPQALSLLAEMQERSGRLDEAVRTAQRALRVQSTSLALSSEAQSCTHHLLGRLMHRSGQLDQAVHHLSEAVRLGPEIIEAYLDLGQAYMDRREHIQAMNVYQQALNTAPNDHRPYILIGQALKESKDYVGAETMFRRAAELAPNDLVIHRQLAAIMALNLVHNRRDFSVEGRSRR